MCTNTVLVPYPSFGGWLSYVSTGLPDKDGGVHMVLIFVGLSFTCR